MLVESLGIDNIAQAKSIGQKEKWKEHVMLVRKKISAQGTDRGVCTSLGGTRNESVD